MKGYTGTARLEDRVCEHCLKIKPMKRGQRFCCATCRVGNFQRQQRKLAKSTKTPTKATHDKSPLFCFAVIQTSTATPEQRVKLFYSEQTTTVALAQHCAAQQVTRIELAKFGDTFTPQELADAQREGRVI